MTEKGEQLKIAMLLDVLKRNVSPLGVQVAAMLLLCHAGQQAETADEPSDGAALIDRIAMAAKQLY